MNQVVTRHDVSMSDELYGLGNLKGTDMDNRPIGVFDSGLGGLTCVTCLLEDLPDERLIYFGDTARTPYGSKAEKTVKNFSAQISDFLVEQGVKMIVIACNTVSSICVEELSKRFPETPIVGIIEPAAEKVAKSCSSENRVGVIGTKVTIGSGVYGRMISEKREDIEVFEMATPAFVPLIEEGFAHSDIMDLTIKYYLDDFILENRIDTLVLGCTHYPLIQDCVTRLYPDLKIINPSQEIVSDISSILAEKEMFAKKPKAENVFYASDLSENFVNMINTICNESKSKIEFKNLDIET